MNTDNNAFLFGVAQASAALGADAEAVLTKAAAFDIVDNSYEMQQLYSRAGANVLALAGLGDSIEARVLCKCASAQHQLSPETQAAYIEPVKMAFVKMAGGPAMASAAGKLFNFFGSGLASMPQNLAIASLLAGGGLGGGAWLLNRTANTEDAETEAKLLQAKKYRQVANQIVQEMKLRQAAQQNSDKPTSSSIY